VFPVNTHAAIIQGHRAFPSISAIPDPIDLAIVCTPSEQIIPIAVECVAKGVKAMVVISAGFAERDSAGAAKQEELVQLCRQNQIRLIGPNCMGIANTAPDIRLHATFGPQAPPRGTVGFLTQSGALGLAMIEHALQHGFGFSSYISYGNKADVSVNDLLEFWETDPDTEQIFLYLESFGNPRNFLRIAARVARVKPVVVLKSARSGAGQRAATSHTAALVTHSDAVVNAALEQAGVLRAHTLEEFTNLAEFLCVQPPPQGRRVSIVTNAGGPGILCADACEEYGLSVLEHSPALQATLRSMLPDNASPRNPVDLLATADSATFARTLQTISASKEVDAQVVIYIPPIAHTAEDTQQEILKLLRRQTGSIPTVLNLILQHHPVAAGEASSGKPVPVVHFPESAARLLAQAARLPSIALEPEAAQSVFGLNPLAAKRVIAEQHRSDAAWLSPAEVVKICSAYRLPHLTTYVASTAAEAQTLALRIGAPVALKAFGEEIIHKTELGAVRLEVAPLEVAAAATAMAAHLRIQKVSWEGFMVQPMAPHGIELFAGIAHDPQFGPVLAVGAGGITVELFHDVQLCVLPVSRARLGTVVKALKISPLLEGYRGLPACDREQFVDLLERLAALALDFTEIAEVDCNPIIATPTGPIIVDARMRLDQKPIRSGTPQPAS
jgi:acyl-CoA synthetase (NDP forming)